MYEVDGLKEGIERAKLNIQIFQNAIDKELETIAEYERMIKFTEAEGARIGNLSRPNSQP